MLNTQRTRLYRLLRRLHPSEHSILLLLAVIIGLATGLAIWLFRAAIDLFHILFVEDVIALLGNILGPASIILILTLSGLVVGWIVSRFIGPERHHGVAGIIEAVALGGGRLPYRKIVFKALASALSLSTGASVGPEDPSVQIGANLGSMVGQKLRMPEDRVRLLVGAGSAGAIAAAFNAPIAGVFFAMEVVLLEFTTGAFGVVVLAAVVSSVVMEAAEQASALNEPALNLMNYTLGSLSELPMYAVLGLVLAPLAAFFIRSVYWQKDTWHRVVHWPLPLQTAAVGAVVGFVGVFFPQVLGSSREAMNELLSQPEQFTIWLLIILGFAKMILTGLSLAGGFVGGVFAPALFVGLMFGGVIGRVVELFNSSHFFSDPQAYAIVGMAAMMAGVVRSPITAIMLVFELTNDYRLIPPIMLASVVCIYVANRFAPLGIYALGLARQGIHLQEGHDVDLMQGIYVDEVMDEPITIHESASLVALRDLMREKHVRSVCVVDEHDVLAGIVTLGDLQEAYETRMDECPALTVADITSREPVTAHPDDVLWRAIRRMGAFDVGRLPVVEAKTNRLVGMVSRHGIIEAYNKAVARKLQDQHHAEQVRLSHLTGAHVIELYVNDDAPIAGMQIQDIHWPAESVVASIQRQNKLLVPHGNTDLKSGDWVTLIAAPEAEDELDQLFGQRQVSAS